MTTRQLVLLNMLHSIGAAISEASGVIPDGDGLMRDYKEFKTALESYFDNRVEEK